MHCRGGAQEAQCSTAQQATNEACSRFEEERAEGHGKSQVAHVGLRRAHGRCGLVQHKEDRHDRAQHAAWIYDRRTREGMRQVNEVLVERSGLAQNGGKRRSGSV